MNLPKALIVTTMLVALTGCTDKNIPPKKLFAIDNSQFKAMFHHSDALNLVLKNKQNKTIDSVAYFNNEVKIGSVKGNSVLKHTFTNEKFGYQNLKAIVYYENLNTEVKTRIELLSSVEPKILPYKLLNTFPHDTNSFTEGLEFYNGFLYESTGKNGNSYIRKVDYKTGKSLQQVDLEEKYFGEGITFIKDKIYQLTYQEATGFIYDAKTFSLLKTFAYNKKIEGWGMTNDKEFIYHSDGTEKIRKLDPETQKTLDYINVYSNSSKIIEINELEWINGKIFANKWKTDSILIIDPKTGALEAIVDLKPLRELTNATPDDTLNGIAYNPSTKTIFVTGKNWDKMFEIKI